MFTISLKMLMQKKFHRMFNIFTEENTSFCDLLRLWDLCGYCQQFAITKRTSATETVKPPAVTTRRPTAKEQKATEPQTLKISTQPPAYLPPTKRTQTSATARIPTVTVFNTTYRATSIAPATTYKATIGAQTTAYLTTTRVPTIKTGRPPITTTGKLSTTSKLITQTPIQTYLPPSIKPQTPATTATERSYTEKTKIPTTSYGTTSSIPTTFFKATTGPSTTIYVPTRASTTVRTVSPTTTTRERPTTPKQITQPPTQKT
ncbi:mucin-2-like, partial [Glossina fuscipes]|uniref:Mucin-2-like n=1 Tax=Glossina fuscipes TaxID=7396 RepID=A0A9C5ZM97_9MUSC